MNEDFGYCKYCSLKFVSKAESATHWRKCDRRPVSKEAYQGFLNTSAAARVQPGRRLSPANQRRLENLKRKHYNMSKAYPQVVSTGRMSCKAPNFSNKPQVHDDAVATENISASTTFGYTVSCGDGPVSQWSVSLNVPRSDTELQDAILRLDRAFSHISVTDATGLAVSLATQEAIVRIRKALRILTDA